MKVLAGILLLVAGVMLPMVMLFQMNSALSRKPAPRPGQVGILLALNGVLPVALVISGLMLLSARFSVSPTLRVVVIATWLASAVLLIVLLSGRGASQGKGGDGGG